MENSWAAGNILFGKIIFRDLTGIMLLAEIALWYMSFDLKLPMMMQVLSVYEGADYLGPFPDLGMVADSLAASPITLCLPFQFVNNYRR